MPAKNRADLINKLHKICKKEYSLITTPSNRTVLEHMIYGAVLEDSTFEAADEAFAKLEENFYDWNEVRVTTRDELAEIVKMVSDPAAAAARVRKSLHGVFEKYYQFDLEFFKKENLSNAVQSMQTFPGVSDFTISYTAQNGLSGHSIPIDQSLMNLMYAIGAVNEKELAQRKIPGLERTIAKAKGIEFSVLVHQLAVAFTTSPFSSNVRNIILKIAPDAKERFPKRASSKPKKPAKVAEEKPAKKQAEPAPATKATPAKASVKKKAPAKKAAKKAAPKKAPAKKASAKKATKKTSKASVKKKAPAKKAAKSTKKKAGKASKKLAKKKPR